MTELIHAIAEMAPQIAMVLGTLLMGSSILSKCIPGMERYDLNKTLFGLQKIEEQVRQIPKPEECTPEFKEAMAEVEAFLEEGC